MYIPIVEDDTGLTWLKKTVALMARDVCSSFSFWR